MAGRYAHLFDAGGNHLSSESHLGGMDIEGRAKAWEKAEEYVDSMLSALKQRGELVYGDIWVKLFSIEIDGVLHGLFYECDEEDPEAYWVMLEPRDIMFHPLWDSGKHST